MCVWLAAFTFIFPTLNLGFYMVISFTSNSFVYALTYLEIPLLLLFLLRTSTHFFAVTFLWRSDVLVARRLDSLIIVGSGCPLS